MTQLRHLIGTHAENTIGALKAHLGVDRLDVVFLDSMEEYYALLGETADRPSADTDGPPERPHVH